VSQDKTLPIQEDAAGITLKMLVQPRAKQTKITGMTEQYIRLAVAAAPVAGKANQECISFLASKLGVGREQITILAGERSRRKLLRLLGVNSGQLRIALKISGQQSSKSEKSC
jgi:uncharacterized protein (TIGR00251 family)